MTLNVLEETDGIDEPFYKGTLLPLNRYVFKDPCENCIVRPICKTRCIPKLKHYNWLDYKRQKKRNITNFLSLYDPEDNSVIELIGIWVATLGFLSAVLLLIGTFIGAVIVTIK